MIPFRPAGSVSKGKPDSKSRTLFDKRFDCDVLDVLFRALAAPEEVELVALAALVLGKVVAGLSELFDELPTESPRAPDKADAAAEFRMLAAVAAVIGLVEIEPALGFGLAVKAPTDSECARLRPIDMFADGLLAQ